MSREAVPPLPPLRDVIARHGLGARKGLGQHFLFDENLTGRIVREAGPLADHTAIEIGPGPGGLTRALLRSEAQAVLAVEIDARCIAALAELAAVAGGRLRVVEADALAVDLTALAAPPRRIVANLPYNVGTRLLLGWLPHPGAYAGITVMLQKEVAERLCAAPRTKAYGRLSIMAQWLWRVRRLFDVPPRAFVPPPAVTSAIVRLDPLPAPAGAADWPALETVTAAAFNQRRKMLRSALRALGPRSDAMLAAAGIRGEARAEELDIAAFCALARAWREVGAGPPEPETAESETAGPGAAP
ncbi:MAG: 16S rRNA (adenine(1518)-N(6)/adenine(1519)-N(6))-dimethyltransferase RsmA [Alphaproteobacteria bacterium]